jgi:Fur family transcriptional regulator, ferric uptake regulator
MSTGAATVAEAEVLDGYLAARRLRRSARRREILDLFLGEERHLTADELYRIVRRRHPSLGFATVYRALKLFCECGLCRPVLFEDGVTRYEHLFRHAHHDHLVCTRCGSVVEVVDPEIERLQDRLARRHGFRVQRHRLELYGLCRSCRVGRKPSPP